MSSEQDPLQKVTVGTMVVMPPQPAVEPGYVLSQQDYFVLLEGAGAGRFRTARDVALGVFVTALVGWVGVAATLPDDWYKEQTRGRSLGFLLILGSATLAAAILTLWFQWRGKDETGRQSYSACCEKITRAFATNVTSHAIADADVSSSAKAAASAATASTNNSPAEPMPEARGSAMAGFKKSVVQYVTPGVRVKHDQFGPGVILAIEMRGAETLLTVHFDAVGVKKVVSRFLEVVA